MRQFLEVACRNAAFSVKSRQRLARVTGEMKGGSVSLLTGFR